MNVVSSSSCCLRGRDEPARPRDDRPWSRAQAASGSFAVDAAGDAPELLLRRLQLARGERQQAIGVERDAFVELSFC